MQPTAMLVTIHRLESKLFELPFDTKRDIFENVVEVMFERHDSSRRNAWSIYSWLLRYYDQRVKPMAQREREIFACAKIDSAQVIDEIAKPAGMSKSLQTRKVGASFFWFVDKKEG